MRRDTWGGGPFSTGLWVQAWSRVKRKQTTSQFPSGNGISKAWSGGVETTNTKPIPSISTSARRSWWRRKLASSYIVSLDIYFEISLRSLYRWDISKCKCAHLRKLLDSELYICKGQTYLGPYAKSSVCYSPDQQRSNRNEISRPTKSFKADREWVSSYGDLYMEHGSYKRKGGKT